MKNALLFPRKTRLFSFLLACSFAFACSKPTLENGLDKFFREYALEKYDSSNSYSAPFYNYLKTTNAVDNRFAIQNSAGENYSLITGNKICDGNIYYREYDNFSFFSPFLVGLSSPETRLYDVFGNCLTGRFYLDDDYIDYYTDHKIAFISPLSGTYKGIFGEPIRNAKSNELLIVEAFLIKNDYDHCYFFKKLDDSFYSFENVISDGRSIDTSEIVFVDYDELLGVNRTNKFECSIEKSNYVDYYYVNKKDKDGKIHQKRNYKSDNEYKTIFSASYMNFSYYYSLESTYLTNDFDFYYDGNFGGSFGINLSKGYYKIHSSHNGKYFPLVMVVSANHDYLWALCLKIGSNKMLDPTYYAVKFSSGGKVSKYYTDVDLLLNEKYYIKFNNDYLLLSPEEYSKLKFLNDFAYVTKGSNDDLIIHYLNSFNNSEKLGITYGNIMCVLDEEQCIFSYDNDGNIYMLDTINDNFAVYTYNKLFDSTNVLYSVGSKLYFQNVLISETEGNSSISRVSEYSFHCKNSYGKYLMYYNLTTKSHYYITCWSTSYEK